MPIDIDKSFYNTGTATVANEGTTVTGQGTAWLQAVRAGDMFGTHVGMPTRVLSVNSNTSLTLAYPWKGAAQTAAAYEIQFTPYDAGYQAAVRALLTIMASGNNEALAGLTGAADKGLHFTGAGTLALHDQTALGRALAGLTGAAGRIPVATAAETAAMRDIVGTVSQSGGVPTGALIERGSNANGDYVRYADGTQMCWHTFNMGAADTSGPGSFFVTNIMTWIFPTTFSVAPSVSLHPTRPFGTSNSRLVGAFAQREPTTSALLDIRAWAPSSAADNVVMRTTATGRWF